MNRQLASSFQKRPVQFFYKQTFSSDFIKRTVQNFVTCGLHGKNFHICFRVLADNIVPHHLALQYGKLAFPASDHNFFIHNYPHLFPVLPEVPAFFLLLP